MKISLMSSTVIEQALRDKIALPYLSVYHDNTFWHLSTFRYRVSLKSVTDAHRQVFQNTKERQKAAPLEMIKAHIPNISLFLL